MVVSSSQSQLPLKRRYFPPNDIIFPETTLFSPKRHYFPQNDIISPETTLFATKGHYFPQGLFTFKEELCSGPKLLNTSNTRCATSNDD